MSANQRAAYSGVITIPRSLLGRLMNQIFATSPDDLKIHADLYWKPKEPEEISENRAWGELTDRKKEYAVTIELSLLPTPNPERTPIS